MNEYSKERKRRNDEITAKYPVGTIVWRMLGRRKDDMDYREAGKTYWRPSPSSIEGIDDHGMIRTNNGGFSINSIGSMYQLTRDECISAFLKNNNTAAIRKDGSYMTFDEDTSEAVTSAMFNKPQTLGAIINPETTLRDSLLTVLADHITIDISDIEQSDPKCGVTFIKLGEIRKRYPKGIITVISENPLNGVIYQIGNSSSGF
ncbi:hypothetical protein AGMMS49975_22490 [Clostridia bacterium]|nr:hypothetical protein AGMMS49975_22490 [Clostridia bacterium]